jgi:hypothetical protein
VVDRPIRSADRHVDVSEHTLEVNGLAVTYEQYFKWREHNLWATRFSPNTRQLGEERASERPWALHLEFC